VPGGEGIRGVGILFPSRKAIAIATALVAMAAGSGTAHAAATRAEYVAQVDPICASAQLEEGIAGEPLAGLTKRVNKHRHARVLERKYSRAFANYLRQFIAIERSVNAQLAAIPPAPEDVSLIQVWLRARGQLLDSEEQFFLRGFEGKNGIKGAIRFFTGFFQFIGRQYEVTDLVSDFGFQHCNQDAGTPELQSIR
jgi:hypothetical protein